MSDQYLTQTQIGKRYGNMSAKKVGKWLQKVGLRNPDGSPTRRAIDGGFCKTIFSEDIGCTFWAWHAQKTLALLEQSIQNPAAFVAAQRERAAKECEEVEVDDEPEEVEPVEEIAHGG